MTRSASRSGGWTSWTVLGRSCPGSWARGMAPPWRTWVRASPTASATSCARSPTRISALEITSSNGASTSR
eukprot:scaffold2745_cov84-Isochrysis_galbana.AAC.1